MIRRVVEEAVADGAWQCDVEGGRDRAESIIAETPHPSRGGAGKPRILDDQESRVATEIGW